MTKSIGIKVEGSKKVYTRCYSTSSARFELQQMLDELKEGQALQIKIGNQYRYIDYENKDFSNDGVMYYIEEYFR